MNAALILAQFASQNVAIFCCALVAGAAVYVSLVEHPAIAEAGATLATGYLLFSQPRPVLYQGAFGVLGGLAGIVAGIVGGDFLWLAGGVMLMFQALSRGNVVVVSPLVSTNPLFTLVLAAVLLRDVERITRRTIVGALLVVLGVVVVTVAR